MRSLKKLCFLMIFVCTTTGCKDILKYDGLLRVIHTPPTAEMKQHPLSAKDATSINLSIVTESGESWRVDWGDGTISDLLNSSQTTYASHTYTSPFTGLIKVLTNKEDNLLELRSEYGGWHINTSDIPRTLRVFRVSQNYMLSGGAPEYLPYTVLPTELCASIYGNISNLPNNIKEFSVSLKDAPLFGQLGHLKTSLEILRLQIHESSDYSSSNVLDIIGDISSLPNSIREFTCAGGANSLNNCGLEGNLSSLKPTVEYMYVTGKNTITGDVANLPMNIKFVRLAGLNTLSGNIMSLPNGLQYFYNGGSNTTSGNIGDLPSSLTYYHNTGSNTTSGNIGDLPSSLTSYYNAGSNTTSGNIGDLPSSLTYYYNTGSNTTSGNIGDLPSSLTFYRNQGSNTTTGNIGNLPNTLTSYYNAGSNTTSGNIGDLPSSLTFYRNQGSNTTTGNISNLPNTISVYFNSGSNTTTGDIATLKLSLIYFYCTGSNTITALTAMWSAATSGFERFYLRGSGLPQNQIDNILDALKNIYLWSGEKSVDLRGTNAAPSATGLISRDQILLNGSTSVSVN